MDHSLCSNYSGLGACYAERLTNYTNKMNRQSLFKYARGISFLAPLFLSSSHISKAEIKPNIILILIDDMGYPAIECYGNKFVRTPNIDRLANQGIRFTHGYVTPQSTPSRASLLTGQYTARNRMWHVIPYYGFPYARVKEPVFLEDLPREQYTLAEALKGAGYTTACIGKWHLSTFDNDGYYTYLYPDKAQYYGFDYVNPRKDPPEYQSYGDKGVDFLTDEAIGFMEKNKNHPFFIYLSHHTVHNPVLAPEELVKKYRNAGYPERGLNFATYLASIEHLDNSIGRLSERLIQLGIEKNTVVIFISDNGGVDAQFDNSPLRYGKGSPYEGGIRVPFIIKWPEKVKGGKVENTPVHIIDIYPTLLDIAGSAKPANHTLEGVSLLPVMKGDKNAIKKTGKRALYFYQPLYDIQWGASPCASIIEGDFKLIHFFGDYIDLDQNSKYIPEGRTELYNLNTDIGERNDLTRVQPEKTQEMLKKLLNWIENEGAEIPGINPGFEIKRWNERDNVKKEE
jgi:arylsulfatase A